MRDANPSPEPESQPGTRSAVQADTVSAGLPRLNTLPWNAPLKWLAAGWRDFRRAPGIGLFYGTVFAGMGWLLMRVFERAPAYTLALSAGFLLMGPFLCLGLYRVSQQLEQGHTPDFGDSLLAFTERLGPLSLFGLTLLVLEMLWGRATLVVFAISFDGMPDFKGSLMALLDPAHLGFTAAWLGIGAVFAWLVYGISAVSMPMLLDRPTDGITAALTSLRLVVQQPGVMLGWAAVMALLTVLAMLPGFLGLLLVAPVVGHASWHAYRAAVGGADGAPQDAAAASSDTTQAERPIKE